MTTLAELTTPMTADEAKASIYAGLAASGVRTTAWKPGATVRTIIAVLALVLAAFSRLQANLAKGGFLETATGQWLTLVAYYVYGTTRSPGTFASGVVTFDNAGGGVYTGGIGDLVVRSSATNKTFRNTASFTIGALATGVQIPFAAVELGSASTAPALTIDELVTTLSGVACSNALALVGTDEETDIDLRTRCSAKLGSLSPRGAKDAYQYVARSAKRADGTPIGITRVSALSDGSGGVDVYLATASGGVTGDAFDPLTDLGAVAADIWTQAEPLAVTAVVQSASIVTIPVTYEWWVRGADGPRVVDLEELPPIDLAAYLSQVPIGGDGGFVRVSALAAVIGGARSDTTRVVITVPAADVAIAIDEAPALGAVTATAVHVGA
jgi:phage-related baseplate assembly protein